jgi:RNA recognition motif-containing protein
MYDRDTGNQRNFAYVEFGDATSLENAIRLNGEVLTKNFLFV